MKTIIISEEQKHKLDLLLEDKEGKNLAKARHYLQNNGYSPEQSQKTVDSIRNDIPNSRLQQCKFILGVARLYLSGQLSDGQSIAELNKTLKYLASDAHVNEYDNNLNNESLQVLVNRFKGVAKDDLQQSMDKSNSRQLTVNKNYTIIPIDNAEEAKKYGKYTSWCVTHQSNMYDSYTNNGTGRFYFCLRNGFEKEPKVEGEGCPLDSYGLSMIAVSVTMEGEVNTITCRWNHDMGGNDNIMTIEQLEDLLGRNFYQTFKPYSREELHAKGVILFDEVHGLLDSGKKPEEVFDMVSSFSEGFARVKLNNKYNFINQEGKLLSNQWYDYVGNFSEGFAIVELNGKWNFINQEGKYISNQWFDWVEDFSEGFARVKLNNKYNFINQEGKLISNQWFDFLYDFSEGFAIVALNSKYNYINQEGKYISNQWFDNVGNFSEGFAIVALNNKYNFINQEGKLLSNQWYDWVGNFHDGFAAVKLNSKRYKINTRGEIVESKNRNKKTIIITEEQKKKLKKAIAAQDQVGGKVNAGVMDAVVGGMCEDATDDKYVIGGEMNAPIGGIYYHVKEGNLNESPDSFASEGFSINGCYPFVKLKYNNTFYIGEMRETHYNLVERLINTGEINDEVFKEDFLKNYRIKPYDYFFDDTMTGRYWGKYNVISFWKTPINTPSKIQKVVDLLQQKISINTQYLLIDYWDSDDIWDSEIPYKWLFNGTYNIFKGKFMQISPSKPMEYTRSGKYTYFRINSKEHGIQYATLGGDILMPMEYFMQASVNESTEPNRMIDVQQVINSDNFKKWFGDWENNPQNSSKVVDENGLPLIVHHGSPKFEGDRFNKSFIGKSMNTGEEGVFCTTPDMNWAKRFSYSASQGSSSVSVKLDTTKQGDILSGFLNIRHPLDFFNLTEEDYNNMWQMVIESKKAQGFDNLDKQKWFDEVQKLLKIGNHQLIKFDLCGGWGNFGDILKQYGYDGYIAKMNPKDSAVEYCFIEPNQFKSIRSFGFNPESESIYESNNKDIRIKEEKTDFGKVLYFNSNNNSFRFALYQYDDEPDVLYLANVSVNKSHRKNGLGNYILTFVDDFANKINASAILLKVKKDSFMFEWYKRNGYKYHSDADSSYVWMIKKMKDKTNVIEEKQKMNDKGEVVPEKCDKCGGKVVLQIHGEPVYVCKDCGKYFGTMPCSLKESIDYSKWLKQLKKRRDPDNIEENIENETKWNGDGQEWFGLIKPHTLPKHLYHTSYKKNRESILKNGIYASIGEEYSSWWNYDGPNSEIPDNDELPEVVFLTDKPYTWADNYYLDTMDVYEIDVNKLDTNLIYLDPSNELIKMGSYCYKGDIPANAIKLIDTRYRNRSIDENVENELSSSEVDLSSFNIKKDLNPDFWIDGHLDSRIRMKLLDIADDFIETLKIDSVKPVDIIMTGSLANFNWNKKYSDIDLHVVYDYNDIDDNKDFIKEYFDSKKQLWNQKHKDLTIYGFNVELYVQDANEEHASSGVYSIEKDKWLVEPDRDTLTTSKVNKEFIKDKASYYATKIDELCYYFKKAKDDEYKIRKISEKAEKLFDEIKKMRKTGFEKSGGKEINSLNIVFKFLRRYGYLEKLSNLRVKSYDKLQGI